MNEFLNYVNTVLDKLVSDFASNSGQFLSSAKLIAGLGAMIAFYMVYKKSVSEAEKINIQEIFRVLALALGIMFYGTFIELINVPLNLISENIRNVSLVEIDKTDDFFESYEFTPNNEGVSSNSKHEEELDNLILQSENELNIDLKKEEDEFGLGSVISSVFNPSSVIANIQTYIAEAIFNIIHFFGVIAIIILNVVRSFFLIVLTYFGIFVFALSIYPTLQNSFAQWLQKYINVYLWLPISYILQGMIAKMFTYFRAADPLSVEGVVTQTNNMIIGCVGLCSIIGFATVPTISSWLINAATSGAGSKIKQKAGGAAQQSKQVAKKGVQMAATGKPPIGK